MSKKQSKTASFPVVLKTLHDDIVKANPSTTLTSKKMRVILRQKMAPIHAKNSSWTFTTQAQYDAARSLFDPTYAKKVAKAPRAPRVKKETKTPVEA